MSHEKDVQLNIAVPEEVSILLKQFAGLNKETVSRYGAGLLVGALLAESGRVLTLAEQMLERQTAIAEGTEVPSDDRTQLNVVMDEARFKGVKHDAIDLGVPYRIIVDDALRAMVVEQGPMLLDSMRSNVEALGTIAQTPNI